MMNKVVLCMACLIVAVAWCAPANTYKPILLKNVESLRFIRGQYALNTRDTTLIPQLECAYNPLNDPSLEPADVICYNKGVDSTGSVMWKCDGIMSKSVDFDNLQVSCEGYSQPGDEYVKEGSCALRYTLKAASPSAQQAPNNENMHHHQPRYRNEYDNERVHERQHYRTQQVEAANGWSFSTVLIFVLVVVLIVRCLRKKNKNQSSTSSTTCDNTNVGQTPDSYTNTEPSAPPYSEDDNSSTFTKRSAFAETTSR